jgi:hypothetical protein
MLVGTETEPHIAAARYALEAGPGVCIRPHLPTGRARFGWHTSRPPRPRQELDMAGFGVVKAPSGDVWAWEPKGAFHGVARRYVST